MEEQTHSAMKAIQLFEQILYPLLFSVGCWILYHSPNAILPIILCQREVSSKDRLTEDYRIEEEANLTGESSQPNTYEIPIPESRSTIWSLGRLAGLLECSDSEDARKILLEASEIIGDAEAMLTPASLSTLGEKIIQVEKKELVNKASERPFFTLANFLWAIAIVGLALTFWPFLETVFGYIVKLVLAVLPKAVISWLKSHIFHPLLAILGQLGPLWVLLVMIGCFSIVVLSYRLKDRVRVLTALTGVALSAATYSYISDSSLPYFVSDGFIQTWFYLYICLSLVPISLSFSSQFLGFLASLSFLLVLNSWILPTVVGKLFHFDPHNYPLEAFSFSCLFMAIFLVVLETRKLHKYHSVFRFGLYFFGIVSFYSTLLVLSNFWYKDYDGKAKWIWYISANLTFLIFLAVFFFLGKRLNAKHLKNTSLLFALIWVVAKVIDSCAIFGDQSSAVATFLVFLVIFGVAFLVRSHSSSLAQFVLPEAGDEHLIP